MKPKFYSDSPAYRWGEYLSYNLDSPLLKELEGGSAIAGVPVVVSSVWRRVFDGVIDFFSRILAKIRGVLLIG